MSKLNRRDFFGTLSAAAIVPLIASSPASVGRLKNFKLSSPVNGFTYNWVGPLECKISSRIKQIYPRIARVDFRANGVLIGSGVPSSNPNQNFYYSWFAPIPGVQADSYTFTAEAIQAGTGNIVDTDTISFIIQRLPF
jgi:hypothetical protein